MVKSNECNNHPKNELCWRCWTARRFCDGLPTELDYDPHVEFAIYTPWQLRPGYGVFRMTFATEHDMVQCLRTFMEMDLTCVDGLYSQTHTIGLWLPVGVGESLVYPGLVSSVLMELAQPNQ